MLVSAWPAVIDRFPSACLLIAGREGRSTAELHDLTTALALDATVTLLGPTSDVADLLSAADVFALSSRFEGLPGVLIEALALEAPVVATDLREVVEVLGDRSIARLVPADDAESLAGGIADALEASRRGPAPPQPAGSGSWTPSRSSGRLQAWSPSMRGRSRERRQASATRRKPEIALGHSDGDRWSGLTPASRAPAASRPHAVRVVGRFARKRRRAVVAVALLSFVAGLLEAASLVLLARVAAAVNDGDEQLGVVRGIEMSRTSALALAAGLVVLKLGCNVAVARRSARLATWALSEARRRLLAGFFESSFERQSEERLGDLQELMTTHVDRVASATLQLTVLISAILSVGTLIVVALAVNPAAAGLIAFGALGLSLLLRPVAAAACRIGRLQSAAGRTFASAVTETVAVAREARVFGVTDRLLDRVMRESSAQAGLYQRSRALLQMAGPLYQSVAMLALIGALAFVATGDGIVLADLGAIVLLLLRAFSYGQQAQSALHQLNDFAPYLEDVSGEGAPVPRRGR